MTAAQPGTGAIRSYRPMLVALLGYVALRGTVMLNGYLYADDFAFRYWAFDSALTPEHLFRSYYGHVQPWGMFAGWVLQSAFPGSFSALMVWTLLMQVATFALLWRIVLRLTGSNVAAGLAFLVPAFGMFGFETGVWWCEITETVPFGLFMMISIWALVRALEGLTGRWWLWSGLAFGAAVISISKGALGLIALFMIAAALPIGVSRRRGIRATLRLNPRYWSLLAGITVGYAIFLRFHAPIARDPNWDFVRALRYSRDLFLLNIVNGSAGGPWWWFSAPGATWNGVLVIPRQSTALLMVAVVLLVATIVIVGRYRPNLFAYLMWMVVYAGALTAIAAYGRGGSLVASSGFRYTFDFWIPLAFFMGLLFYPVIGEDEPFPRSLRIPRRTAAVAAGAALLTSSLVSAVEPSLRWVTSRTKQYVRTAVASVPAIPQDAEFLPQKTMTDLVHPILMLPFASTEVVFAPDPAFRPFVTYATGGLYGFGREGEVQQQWIAGASTRPNGVCGYRLSASPTVLPMTRRLPQWTFVAEVAYLSDTDTAAKVTIGPTTHDVPLRAGLHNVSSR